MRSIDIHKEEYSKRIHQFYNSIEQPMKVYYSKESLLTDNRGRVLNIIENINQWVNLSKKLVARDNGYAEAELNNIIYLDKYHIYLKTEDKYIPEDFNEYGDKKLTDKKMGTGGYIRLYGFSHRAVTDILYTSSGIWNVTLNHYHLLSVALRPTGFLKHNINTKSKDTYKEKLSKLMDTRKPKIADLRLFNLLFNPYSFAYMDTDRALKLAYPNIRREDRPKILETERFRRLFMSEMTKMMPNLIEGIQATNSPQDIGIFIKQMREKALEKGSTDDQIKVLAVTLQAGYGSMIANPTTEGNIPLVLDAHHHNAGDTRLIPAGDEYNDADIKSTTEEANIIDDDEDTTLKKIEKEIIDIYDDNPEKEQGSVDEEATSKLSDKEFEAAMEYHAVSDMYLED